MLTAPRVSITNEMSKTHTVLEISGSDRPHLLYDVTRKIAQLGLQINSASVSTYGDRAVDVFYVKDIFQKNKKVRSWRGKSLVGYKSYLLSVVLLRLRFIPETSLVVWLYMLYLKTQTCAGQILLRKFTREYLTTT